MIPSPIRNVLETLQEHSVQCMLMGGQACVLYGAAEFSRDLDLVITARADALAQLQNALVALQAERIAVPALDLELLERGHGVHFRCKRNDVYDLRLDILTKPPRIKDIDGLWKRQVRMVVPDGDTVPVISLTDLVETKKTQRDKDWAMIGSLVDADIVRNQQNITNDKVSFWLHAARSTDQLIRFTLEFPTLACEARLTRPLISYAIQNDPAELEFALAKEQIEGKAADRAYWAPLLAELEEIRWSERRSLS